MESPPSTVSSPVKGHTRPNSVDYAMHEPGSGSFSGSDDTEASLYHTDLARTGTDVASALTEDLHYPSSWSHRELAHCKLMDDWVFAANGPFGYATAVSESRGPNGEVVYTLDHTDFMTKIEKESQSTYKVQFSRCSKFNTWLLALDETRVGMIRREHVAKRIERYLEMEDNLEEASGFDSESMHPVLKTDFFERAWPAAWEAISREYENVWMSAGAAGEMRARMLISPVLGELARFSGWKLLNFTEHSLSEGFERQSEADLAERTTEEVQTFLSNPTRIEHMFGEMELTGKIDYLLYGFKNELSRAQLQQLRPVKTLNETLAGLDLHHDHRISILLVEAKAEPNRDPCALLSKGTLADHIPQIVMEAYVALVKSNRRAVPWVLTDGLTWIFGVLHVSDDDDINRFGHLTVEPIDFNGEGARSQSNEENMATIFRLLTFWAFGNPESLYQNFLRRKWGDRVRDKSYADVNKWPTLPIKLVIPMDVGMPPRFTQQEYAELWGDEVPATSR